MLEIMFMKILKNILYSMCWIVEYIGLTVLNLKYCLSNCKLGYNIYLLIYYFFKAYNITYVYSITF